VEEELTNLPDRHMTCCVMSR